MEVYRLIDNSGPPSVSAIRSIDGSGDRMIVSLNGQDIIKDHTDPRTGRPMKKKIKGATNEQLAALVNDPEKWGPGWDRLIMKVDRSVHQEAPVEKKGRAKKKSVVKKSE